MTIFTIGGAVTGLGIAWKYRHGIMNAVKWKTREYEDPEPGQVWSYAGLKPLDSTGKGLHTFTVDQVTEDEVFYVDNWNADAHEECHEDIETWHHRMARVRGFVHHRTTVENDYWGDAAEE